VTTIQSLSRVVAAAGLLASLVARVSLTHAEPKVPPPYKPAANADEAVARIAELGGAVRHCNRSDDTLEVDFQYCGTALTDAHLQYVLSLNKVVILRLKATAITDAGLVHVGKVSTLKRFTWIKPPSRMQAWST
jgi:hypothetical protein